MGNAGCGVRNYSLLVASYSFQGSSFGSRNSLLVANCGLTSQVLENKGRERKKLFMVLPSPITVHHENLENGFAIKIENPT